MQPIQSRKASVTEDGDRRVSDLFSAMETIAWCSDSYSQDQVCREEGFFHLSFSR